EPLQRTGSCAELSHMKYPNQFIHLRSNSSLKSHQPISCSGQSKTDPKYSNIPGFDISKAGNVCRKDICFRFLLFHTEWMRKVSVFTVLFPRTELQDWLSIFI